MASCGSCDAVVGDGDRAREAFVEGDADPRSASSTGHYGVVQRPKRSLSQASEALETSADEDFLCSSTAN